MLKTLTVYYLEITDPKDFRTVEKIPPDVRIIRVKEPCPLLNQFFYRNIGRDWDWIDRRDWSPEQWNAYVSRPQLETWIVHYKGTPAGYIELDREPEETIQIAYLGLLPQFTGKRIGKYVTSFAIQHAFDSGAKRVWLSTCSFDHPAALNTYLHRGFTIFKTEEIEKEFPED